MALSNELRRLIQSAELGETNDAKYVDRHAQEALAALIMWVESHDSLFQFLGAEGLNGATASTLAPAGGVLSVDVEVDLTDTLNKLDTFNQSAEVTVTMFGGSATGKKLNGGTSPVVLTMQDGKATVTASATSTGTMILHLSAPSPASLGVTDVLTITLS